MTNYKAPRINLEPNTKSLADGTNTLQRGRPPGILVTSSAPMVGKGNPGIYIGPQLPFAVIIDGFPRIGNFHLIKAIEGTWLSAATRKLGWGARYGAEQGYGAYVKGIVRRMDGSFIWGPAANRIKPDELFYIKIYEGKDEETVPKRPEPKKRVSQIVYNTMSSINVADGSGKIDIWSFGEQVVGSGIDSISQAVVDGPLASALSGDKISDEKKRQDVKTTGDELEKVDIGLYDEFESSWVQKIFRKTGWFNFHWANSGNNNIIVIYTKICATKGKKDADLYRTTETVDRDKFLSETVAELKRKVLHIDKDRKPRKITSNEARMICPK